jgi:hypothetical protein
MNSLLETALEYKRDGYSVIPVIPLDKKPLIKWKGRQQAAADEEEIRDWWRSTPTANVGIVTGKISGLTVVDIDGELGEESIRTSKIDLPRTFQVNSPRGRHLYYEYTPRLKNSAGLLPGVDVRNDGGYIVAPPSKRAEGEYEVTDDAAFNQLGETSITILNSRSTSAGKSKTVKLGSKVVEGSRNDTAFKMALKLVRDGKDRSGIFKILSLENESNFIPPLSASEINSVVYSAWEYGLKTNGIRLAKSLVASVINSGDRSLLFDHIPTIARLSGVERMKCLDHLKNSSLKIPITKLSTAIDEERAKIGFTDHEQASGDGLPIVQLSGRSPKDIVEETLGYLRRERGQLRLFQVEGRLFRIDQGPIGRLKTVLVDEEKLASCLVDTIDFHRKTKPVFPPRDLLKSILGRSDLGFDELRGITSGPIWRSDGKLIVELGFDSESGMFLSTENIDIDPTKLRTVEWAKERLESLLNDFPFVQSADRENAIALIVSLVYRPSIRAATPMFVVTAPQAGTGKTLLTDVACLMSTGAPAPLSPPPSSEEEMRKRITSILLSSAPVAVLDNCENAVTSQALSVVLTAESWSDRILGRSESVSPPNNTTWIATGNKIGFRGDLLRRTIPIKLDSDHSTPWTRSGFRIDDLRGHVLEKRDEYLEAVCVLISNWINAGSPPANSQTVLGGFEKWMQATSGIMALAGFTEFASNLNEWWDEHSESESDWQRWFEGWFEHRGSDEISTAKLIKSLDNSAAGLVFGVHPPSEVADLADIEMISTDPRKRGRSLGKVLSRQTGKRFGPYKLLKRHDSKTNSLVWSMDGSGKASH